MFLGFVEVTKFSDSIDQIVKKCFGKGLNVNQNSVKWLRYEFSVAVLFRTYTGHLASGFLCKVP